MVRIFMKRKLPCAYVYSDQAFDYLNRLGFLLWIEKLPEQGCRRALLPLIDSNNQSSGFVFYEVLDEDLFLDWRFGNKARKNMEIHIQPHLVEEEIIFQDGFKEHKNSVFQFINTVESNSGGHEPWRDYLSLRKNPGLQAVILGCRDFENVKSLIKFEKEFTYNNKVYGVIHFGPHCFDVLITTV